MELVISKDIEQLKNTKIQEMEELIELKSRKEEARVELPAAWVEEGGEDGAGGDVLRLSDPEGLLFSNDAISTCFARLEERLEARGVEV